MKWRSLDEAAPAEDTRSLREQFAERKELIAKYVPTETQAIHARVIAELKEHGIDGRALSRGAKAPAFDLNDHNGKPVSSAELLTQGRLVICFFRGRWCPFCVGQLEAMNLILPQIEQAGASLIAISPQTVQQSFFMADQHKLRFPLLSDPGNSRGPSVWTGVPRARLSAGGVSAGIHQSALRQRRRNLGTSYSCDLHPRPQRLRGLRLGQC